MHFDFTLSDLINFAILSLILVVAINIIVVSDNSKRYYLDDKAGNISQTVFTRTTIHNGTNLGYLYFKLFLNGVTGGLATIALAAIVTGTIRGSVGDLDKGSIAHVLFIWFSFQQIKRVTIEHYILKAVIKTKPRTVKIDGNQHFICRVDKMPWVLSNGALTGLLAMLASVIFVQIF